MWMGGPIGPLALHVAGGYAYQRELSTGSPANFATFQADLDLEIPVPFVVPYAGLEGMAWFPIGSMPGAKGVPLMAGPHAGLRFSFFELAAFDVWAFGYPWGPNLWNLSDDQGLSFQGKAWGAGGKASVKF
jgi:hypothetical protein